MATKVKVCGNYNCAFCTEDGQCRVNSIGIGKDGRCINYFYRPDKPTSHYPTTEEEPPSLR